MCYSYEVPRIHRGERRWLSGERRWQRRVQLRLTGACPAGSCIGCTGGGHHRCRETHLTYHVGNTGLEVTL